MLQCGPRSGAQEWKTGWEWGKGQSKSLGTEVPREARVATWEQQVSEGYGGQQEMCRTFSLKCTVVCGGFANKCLGSVSI